MASSGVGSGTSGAKGGVMTLFLVYLAVGLAVLVWDTTVHGAHLRAGVDAAVAKAGGGSHWRVFAWSVHALVGAVRVLTWPVWVSVKLAGGRS